MSEMDSLVDIEIHTGRHMDTYTDRQKDKTMFNRYSMGKTTSAKIHARDDPSMKNSTQHHAIIFVNVSVCLSLNAMKSNGMNMQALYPLISFSFTSELMAKGGVLCIAFAAVHFKGNSFLT